MSDNTNWLEITLNLPSDALDSVCARLTANGVTGLVVEDETDFKTFLEENRPYWDYVDDELMARMAGACRVKLYVTDDEDGKAALRGYLAGLEQYEYTELPLAEEDWATGWQKYYKPLTIGEKIYVVPQWMRDEPVPAGRVPLYLNPGLTFGTGSHASTQLCLEGLEKVVGEGDKVLDLGCGSGILAIAALGLGASHALGVDIDPKAVDVSYENAEMNGIGKDKLTVVAGDVLSDAAFAASLERKAYRVVLANIVADVIIPLSAQVADYLTSDGWFLCSGVIDTRADEVQAALERNGLLVTERRERNGWVSFTARLAFTRK